MFEFAFMASASGAKGRRLMEFHTRANPATCMEALRADDHTSQGFREKAGGESQAMVTQNAFAAWSTARENGENLAQYESTMFVRLCRDDPSRATRGQVEDTGKEVAT